MELFFCAVGIEQLGVARGEIEAKCADLTDLATRLGEWALLLSLANGQLRNEVASGSPLKEAITFVIRIHDEIGLTAFDPANETERTRCGPLHGRQPALFRCR